MLRCISLCMFLALGFFANMTSAEDSSAHECALNFKVKNIDGEVVDLEDYEGNVVMIVNTASRCGMTPQYSKLQAIQDKYKEKGFVILGFPCNQFGSQEPGSEADIKSFCSTKYSVSFPMFSKVEVNGEGAADLYKHLTSQDVKPLGKGNVKWNFEKFLIDREGNLINRFASSTSPEDAEVIKAIEAELAKG
jgi:glutathione peroxidase